MTTKRKHRKPHQKGGNNFMDSDFIRCFNVNLARVMDAVNEYSGKHNIDQELAHEFINGQTSAIRREAAQNLIQNTIYITLEEVEIGRAHV